MGPNPRGVSATLRHPPFLACVVVLVGAIIGAGPVAERLKIVLRKEAVPLRRPLNKLDKAILGPYRFTRAYALDQAVVDALGTDVYIDWEFKDRKAKDKTALRRVRLFVTYYTGQPDLVPHVPDECYQAAGYTLLERGNTHVDVPSVGAKDDRLPVRLLGFEQKSEGLFSAARGTDNGRVYVLYFFLTNGRFVTTRNQVRVQTANLTQRYAYFAKFEVKFTSDTGKAANESESLAAMQKLMRTVLPVFLGDHFADWEALQSAAEG